jgi:CheY-like chemotaxis protein
LSRALSAAVVRRRTSVLVVDDEPLMLEMIQSMLEAEYDLATFSDPRAALAAMLAGSFDVILCDLMMPELTGMDIYERVCVERSALAGKFIFISGGAFTERARTFVASNTRPLLTKPFHRAELLELLDLIAAQWMGSPSGSGHSEGPQG